MQTLQIRNVSVEVADVLKQRAASRGQSLSEYLRLEVERLAARPDLLDYLADLGQRPRRHVDVDVSSVIREMRDDFDESGRIG